MRRFKIRNKTYRFVEELPNRDSEIVAFIYKILDSKKDEYLLIKSTKCYTLYKDDKRVLQTYSIQEMK